MIESSRAFNELYGPKPIEGKSKMNERIRELAKQAGFQFDEYNEATARKVEALGKLLVRECADYIRTNLDSWDAEPLAFCMERDFDVHGDYA